MKDDLKLTIHKFVLEPVKQQTVEIPKFSKILSIQLQGDNICMWVEGMPHYQKYQQKIIIIATGQELPPEAHFYIDTLQVNSLVWHFYGEFPKR